MREAIGLIAKRFLFAGLVASALVLASCINVEIEHLQESSNYPADQNQQENIVLTSVGPIFTITSALLADTNIKVINMPERARSLAAQPTWFDKQSEPFYEVFERAIAVVSMGNLWPEDSLYLTVREQNIRAVNIDATLPYSSQLTGVSVVNGPSTGEVSPYFWLSPANIIRSAKIVSNDLTRLFPNSAETIRKNEQAISAQILNRKRDFEVALIELDPYLYALADEFSYLTNEFGIYVEDYFVKQDINWTEADLTNLTATLKANNIPLVIHKWEPSEDIQNAISEAGSRLVVLNTFESALVDLDALASQNLDALLEAFQ